ncbi:MAG TPA: hypothetical protein VIY52_17355 [Streptosporangiaceae bacterium]
MKGCRPDCCGFALRPRTAGLLDHLAEEDVPPGRARHRPAGRRAGQRHADAGVRAFLAAYCQEAQ